jgi:hypothetical protein
MILQDLVVSTGRPIEEVSNKQSISSGAAAASCRRSFGAPNRSCSEPPIARGCKRTSVRRICREFHPPGRVPKCIRRGDTETSDLEEFPRTQPIDFVSIIIDGSVDKDCLTLQRRSNVRAREPGNSVLAPPDERLTTDLSRVNLVTFVCSKQSRPIRPSLPALARPAAGTVPDCNKSKRVASTSLPYRPRGLRRLAQPSED